MKLELIKSLAKKFRRKIESYPNKDDLFITLQNFPKGSCGDASLLLNHSLQERGITDFTYYSGVNQSGQSHAWLKHGEWILDITADQFGKYPEVWLTKSDEWHSQFNTLIQEGSSIQKYIGSYPKEDLLATYEKIWGEK